MLPDNVMVLGVPVRPVTEEQVLAFVAATVDVGRPKQVATVNAEYIMRARRDQSFMMVLQDSDLNTPDGAGVLWALRHRGIRVSERAGGADLIWSIAEQAAARKHRLFLLGARPGVAEQAGLKLQRHFPDLAIVGSCSGRPEQEWDARQVEHINRTSADILFVAFGAPAQDEWIARNKARLQVPVSMGMGGSFDYVAGTASRAPRWMRAHGLEWLYRLIRQPWRWRRMLVLPQFVWLALTRKS